MDTPEPCEDTQSAEFILHFFSKQCGHPLIAWQQYFDRNNDKRVVLQEFVNGMQRMGYTRDSEALFYKLDDDGSGFLTISEVAPSSSDLWASFRHWAGKTFFSEEDMIEKLSGRKFVEKSENSKKAAYQREDRGLTKKHFYAMAPSLGWYGGFEQILFLALDPHKVGTIYQTNLPWFEEERKRQIAKAKFKTRGREGGLTAMRKRLHALRSLQSFTQWLRYHYGRYLFHPWRRSIDKDGSMTVSRLELFTFCKNHAWRGDSNALWHALDSDDSGVTSLDEFAGAEARHLALFKKWIDDNYGSSREAFKAMLAKCRKKGPAARGLDKDDFAFAIESLGYSDDAYILFDILDWEVDGDGMVTAKELRFLDIWAPVKWLQAESNPEAAAEFKHMLFDKWPHPLKAWRALDEDLSGKVNFQEFRVVADQLGFKGDVQGAWTAMDDDASGYIALAEIHKGCAYALAEFRRWANLFFGSVLDAFRTLDSDGGGSLSRAEFKKSVTKFGFNGDREELFTLLDVAGDGDISLEEMAFLDEWEISEVYDEPIPSFQEVEALLRKHRAESDSEESDFEELPEHMILENRVPRQRVVLSETQLPVTEEDESKKHVPTVGAELMELLGEFSARPRFNSFPLTESSIRSSKSWSLTGNSLQFTSICSTDSRHPSVLSGQRPKHIRTQKIVPYIGGRPFMAKQGRARASSSRRRNPSNRTLPALVQRPVLRSPR